MAISSQYWVCPRCRTPNAIGAPACRACGLLVAPQHPVVAGQPTRTPGRGAVPPPHPAAVPVPALQPAWYPPPEPGYPPPGSSSPASPLGAVNSVFRGYADFRGRSRRSEFWWWATIQLALVVVWVIGILAMESMALLNGLMVYWLVTLCPSVAVAVRRLHDAGRSGWWLALYFVPTLGALVLLVLWALPSQHAANRWGLPPT